MKAQSRVDGSMEIDQSRRWNNDIDQSDSAGTSLKSPFSATAKPGTSYTRGLNTRDLPNTQYRRLKKKKNKKRTPCK